MFNKNMEANHEPSLYAQIEFLQTDFTDILRSNYLGKINEKLMEYKNNNKIIYPPQEKILNTFNHYNQKEQKVDDNLPNNL